MGAGPGTLQTSSRYGVYGGCGLTQAVGTLGMVALKITANLGPFSKEFRYDVLIGAMFL